MADRNMAWTDTDLDILQSMDAAGLPIDQMARRLGRSEADIGDHLAIVRARTGAVPFPGERVHHADEDRAERSWEGPDEEGDVPLPSGGRADDSAAWVHINPPDRK